MVLNSPSKLFRWVHPSLYEGVSVRPSVGWSVGWSVTCIKQMSLKGDMEHREKFLSVRANERASEQTSKRLSIPFPPGLQSPRGPAIQTLRAPAPSSPRPFSRSLAPSSPAPPPLGPSPPHTDGNSSLCSIGHLSPSGPLPCFNLSITSRPGASNGQQFPCPAVLFFLLFFFSYLNGSRAAAPVGDEVL